MARDFLGYLDRISDGATRAQIAKIAGVSGSTVTRWDPARTDHITPKADAVIAIAQHYGKPPLEALIEAGILTPSDAGVRITQISLADFPHTALLRELQHRLDEMSDPAANISGDQDKEDPSPDDYDLAAGSVARPDDRTAD